jgi:hypothetical protein
LKKGKRVVHLFAFAMESHRLWDYRSYRLNLFKTSHTADLSLHWKMKKSGGGGLGSALGHKVLWDRFSSGGGSVLPDRI